MNKNIVALFLSFLICFMMFVLPASGQNTGKVILPPDDDGTEEEWTAEDVDKKIDMAIAILKVIQSEVKELEKEEARAAKQDAKTPVETEDKDQAWIDSMKQKVGTMIRVWSRVRQVVDEETKKSGGEPQKTREDEETAKELSEKLDTTIKAMTAIKEELDKIESKDKK